MEDEKDAIERRDVNIIFSGFMCQRCIRQRCFAGVNKEWKDSACIDACVAMGGKVLKGCISVYSRA